MSTNCYKYHPNPHTSSQKLLPFLACQLLTGSSQIMPHLCVIQEQKARPYQKVLTESGHYPVHSTSLIQISQGNHYLLSLASLSALRGSYSLPAAFLVYLCFGEETGGEGTPRAVTLLGSHLWHCLPLSLCGISPKNKRQKTIPEMTRIFWVLWSWEVYYWSDPQPAELRCLTEPLAHQAAPRQLHGGSPSSQVPCLAECPAEAHFFQRPELLSDPAGPCSSPSPQETPELWDPRAGSLSNTCTRSLISWIPATKARDWRLFELDVENQSSFFKPKKLLTWKE